MGKTINNHLSDLLRVYFIMGTNNSSLPPLAVLKSALVGGITLFQFREKGLGALKGEDKKQIALQMKQLCDDYSVPFIVNDDVQLAIEIGAAGVHVGQDDEPITMIKKQCPDHFIVGVSATNEAEAAQALKDGADYIGVGPIYATNTKADAKVPIGLKGISNIRSTVGKLSMVAIGGIKKEHVNGIIKAGANGVAIISAISQADAAKEAARSFLDMVDDAAGDITQ
ncbi:thiamine phosphate synthase [Radiobacillus sp. PE A8.2]|uniref:thiamine phosphate synthase n=1 Tax=Radiobacillus sp. PE A8.2 TaxID=3380349 RepID=UPI0038910E9E